MSLEINLHKPDMCHGWGVEFSDSNHFPEDFRGKVIAKMKEVNGSFLQSDCLGYIYVEFFFDDETAVINAAEKFSSLIY